MNNHIVAVLMGSDSDLATVQPTLDILDRLGVTWQVKITSAHRTPSETRAFIAPPSNRAAKYLLPRLVLQPTWPAQWRHTL